MKRISIIATFICCLFTFACTDLDEKVLDRLPENDFPENDKQAALRTVPTYQELADLIDDAGWWFWVQGITGNEVVFPVRLTDWVDGGKWKVLYQHTWDNNTEAINRMWSHMYDGVVEANRAIDELAPFEAEEAAQITLAKLKVLRAFYYYLLIDNYGDVPYVTNFFEAEAQPTKNCRGDICNAIIAEVEAVLDKLPANSNNFAVSKGMAYALLAKLYLNAEVYTGVPQWEKAEAYCDSIINSGLYALEGHPLQPFVTNNESSIENIFTIPFDENNLQGFRLHMRTLHYLSNQTYDMAVGPWNGCAAVEEHYNLYETDDLRREGFIVGLQKTSGGQTLFDETAETDLIIDPFIPALEMDASYEFAEIRLSGARIAKYEIAKGSDENLSNDFPLFRYADILLMKAEAMIRQGKNGDQYVNQVRGRAGVSAWSSTTLDQILEERGREMFCEGHRRQDLIRFGRFLEARWEKEVSTPDRRIFPIPQWAIDANPNLGTEGCN